VLMGRFGVTALSLPLLAELQTSLLTLGQLHPLDSGGGEAEVAVGGVAAVEAVVAEEEAAAAADVAEAREWRTGSRPWASDRLAARVRALHRSPPETRLRRAARGGLQSAKAPAARPGAPARARRYLRPAQRVPLARRRHAPGSAPVGPAGPARRAGGSSPKRRSPMSPDDARERLVGAQEAFLRSLLENTEVPPGFDRSDMEAAAEALASTGARARGEVPGEVRCVRGNHPAALKGRAARGWPRLHRGPGSRRTAAGIRAAPGARD
jgi:hypothetical protein